MSFLRNFFIGGDVELHGGLLGNKSRCAVKHIVYEKSIRLYEFTAPASRNFNTMKKPTITRTFGPIHFEDLEPHRFEDLIRELIYDYKEWQSIEATGRGGSDDGFDIRAYEKLTSNYREPDEEDAEDTTTPNHPMDGNMWMIQCKRENEIGPQKVSKIISENINAQTPPYGYILVASANFSKKAYDTFREELKKVGVMEFYLWGKAELEDMLHMPRYDRILFTFFGVSFISRKRSLTTEIRSFITVKNKLYKLLGEQESASLGELLVRDINDDKYPIEEEYPDFDERPRWAKYSYKGPHVYGIWLEVNKCYGYIDKKKKEWDLTESVNVNKLYEQNETDEERTQKMNQNRITRSFWESLPLINQAQISIWGLLRYKDISIVDDKGDPLNKMIHIYSDFKYAGKPFKRLLHVLGDRHDRVILERDDYTRIKMFSDEMPEPKQGKTHKKNVISVSETVYSSISRENPSVKALFDVENKYSYLNDCDKIQIKNEAKADNLLWIKITSKYKISVSDYAGDEWNIHNTIQLIKEQTKKEVTGKDEITVFEFLRTYAE